jgi:1-acyl-sn-glycerol-3-phosphate acyltransferase
MLPRLFMSLNCKLLQYSADLTSRSSCCFSNCAFDDFDSRKLCLLPQGTDVALTKLNRGEWVHIFPEGSRSRDATLQIFKRGVGRLVLDSEKLPIVVPFIHKGMNDVMPIGAKLFSTGKKVRKR